MKFYHDKKNAESYAAICEGYNASEQLEMLYERLPEGASVLELGSGPGNDLELLDSRFQVTGSDYSPAFIEMLEKRFPSVPLLPLDAVTIQASGSFDAIYSNKVLQHLDDEELASSFSRQSELLNPGGYVFHLIWCRIDSPPTDNGLLYIARDIASMKTAMGSGFELIRVEEFGEFEDRDSLAILARKT